MSTNSMKLVKGVGFSKGCALLALKNPPPFVPSSLIASCEATGPKGMTWDAPSKDVTWRYEPNVCTTPCDTNNNVKITLMGKST